MDSIILFLDQVYQFLVTVVSSPLYSLVAGLLVEGIFRLFPTEKPNSIAWAIVGFLKALATAFDKAKQVVGFVAEQLDKVLPQNVKA